MTEAILTDQEEPPTLAPLPSFALAAATEPPVDTVTPTDVRALRMCDPGIVDPDTGKRIADSWNRNQWYTASINGMTQANAGPVVPDDAGGPYCYKTLSAFTFSPAGRYDIQVSLINHCAGRTDPDPMCQAAAKDPTWNMLDAVGPATALTVISAPLQCSYTLSASEQSFPASGGAGNVAIVTAAGCPWTVTGGASWVPVGSNGTGPSSVTFTVQPNAGTTSRSADLTIAGQTFTVRQAGVPTTDPCAVPLGVDLPFVTILRWGPSPLKAGQRAYVLYQLASRTPIVEVVVKVNDAPVKTKATDTDDGATWFTAPATKGTYKLAISARNGVCPAVEKVSSVNLVTK